MCTVVSDTFSYLNSKQMVIIAQVKKKGKVRSPSFTFSKWYLQGKVLGSQGWLPGDS